ncbi:histidine kinase [Beutenbergia cavernae DSM 12333]|uniref:Signal transduction histidine-protein kinase/phosphatase MprB n=1 Tax=Beutenbergia cavernae (strain ATCC BAA-8 / DSM 12333 / CCUG 43141 / JCM 11478 / NBRC 16432 / NCIMB 13614 / HKI 0122) TaxID=471853 RepID=C5C1R7_BEUC1|nr:HAMP domain-containing sensor histidine kinase [Beutenbergia cavernae]ACQ79535.1 histidine kinase [Beutenbergia cavernae DSM 12333]
MSGAARHARSGAPTPPLRYAALDVRPLDRLTSIKYKLGVLVAASVTVSSFVVWWGRSSEPPLRWYMTFPFAIALALVVTQLLARGMTSPLREMTSAARAMSNGEYGIRVRATSHDEVGQLAHAFNAMARDLASVDEARREIVANVSHELRTPVAALRAQLENMVDGVTRPDEEALQAALDQTERLTRLVTYLLDLSRLEAGATGLHLQDVEVQDFLEEVVDAASHAARAAGRTVAWEVSTSPEDLHVRADAERLHQVVLNLLANATRHSPPGGTVRVRASQAPIGDEIVIDVVDEGTGIPPEERERIFERFQRGNAPAQTGGISTGGTGLGLAIARWAVGLHGGTLTVVDTERTPLTVPVGADRDERVLRGQGATLRIRLPIDGPAERSEQPSGT